MADPPPYPGTPRWVKVFGIIALVVVLLFVILLFTRGPGGHGPVATHRPVALAIHRPPVSQNTAGNSRDHATPPP